MAIKLAEAYVELKTQGFAGAAAEIDRLTDAYEKMADAAARATGAASGSGQASATAAGAMTSAAGAAATYNQTTNQATHNAYNFNRSQQTATTTTNNYTNTIINNTRAVNQNAAATGRGAGQARNWGFEWYQAGQMIEDAGVGYTLNGWAGAFLGAANNASYLVARLNPVAGALTGVAAGIGIVTMKLLGMSSATKDSNEQLEQHLDILRQLALQRGEDIRQQMNIADMDNAGDAASRVNSLETEFASESGTLASFQAATQRTTGQLESARGTLNDLRAEYEAFKEDWGGVIPLLMTGDMRQAIADQEALIPKLEQQLAGEFEAMQQQRAVVENIGRELDRTRERAADLARQESLGDRFSQIGGFLSGMPEAAVPIALDLEQAGNQFSEFMAEQNALFDAAQQAQRDKDRELRLRAKDIERTQGEVREARQAEFGGISDLARRLQERSGARQEELLRQGVQEQRASREVLERIAEAGRTAVAG